MYNMKNLTVDEILKYYYRAIDSSKLNEDNIIIDENLVVEDSKNKYLKEFANFLNDSYWKGYRISESIISKLMNIIEYTGYEYQLIKQYIDILNSCIISRYEEIPNTIDITPQRAIEYINLYISCQDDKIPYYITDKKFNTNCNELYTLIEIEDPISIIIKDMKEWISKHSNQ